jgi:glutathione S-transferase
MIDLHYAPTPNGWKISIMLEELGLPYRVIPVNIRAGEQFRPEFLAISPNNRIPSIVDHEPADDDYPNVKRWYADMRARPQVQAGLAIGKFVKEPFDEEARRNMFGARAKEMRS